MFNKEDFYRAFGDYAGVSRDITITGVDEVEESDGYCETCYYEYTATYVIGTDEVGEPYRERVWASLGEFIKSL